MDAMTLAENGRYVAGALPVCLYALKRFRWWMNDRADRYAAIVEFQAVECWMDENPGAAMTYDEIVDHLEAEAYQKALEAHRLATHYIPSTQPDPTTAEKIAQEAGVPTEVVQSAVDSAISAYRYESASA